MENIREKLYHKIIDFIFGEYDQSKQDYNELQENIKDFKERLVRWKIDFEYRQLIGPLQPAEILSKTQKIPSKTIEKISREVNIILPKKINIKEFSLELLSNEDIEYYLDNEISEDLFLSFIASIETPKEELDVGEPFQPKSFEFVDLSGANRESLKLIDLDSYSEDAHLKLHIVQYLESLISKVKSGELHNMAVVSLFTNKKASIFVPKELTDSSSQKLIDTLINKLKNSEPATEDQ